MNQAATKKIPTLRFPEFTNEWEEKKFPEISEFQEGPGILAKDFRQTGIPLIRLAGLQNGKVTLDGCNYLDQEMVAKKWHHFRICEGDLLLSTSGTLGQVSEVANDTVGSVVYTGIIRFWPKKDTSSEFLKLLFDTSEFGEQVKKQSSGAVLHHFGPTHLKSMHVSVPQVNEQEKIASFLSSVDEWIENLREQKNQIEKYKKGMMQKIFSQEIRFKDEDGNDFPEWKQEKLGSIFSIQAGGDIGKIEFSKTKDDLHTFPVYANALTKKGLVGYSKFAEINIDCVTVTGRGNVGHAIARRAGFTPVVRLLTLIPKEDLSAYFFECAINNLHIFIESTGVPQLTSPQLSIYKIKYPSHTEQEIIAELLSLIDQQIEAKENQIRKAGEWKKGLLQQMFV